VKPRPGHGQMHQVVPLRLYSRRGNRRRRAAAQAVVRAIIGGSCRHGAAFDVLRQSLRHGDGADDERQVEGGSPMKKRKPGSRDWRAVMPRTARGLANRMNGELMRLSPRMNSAPR